MHPNNKSRLPHIKPEEPHSIGTWGPNIVIPQTQSLGTGGKCKAILMETQTHVDIYICACIHSFLADPTPILRANELDIAFCFCCSS
jgi:hypothetical protein